MKLGMFVLVLMTDNSSFSLVNNLKQKKCINLRKKKLINNKDFYNQLFKFGYKSSRNNKEKIEIYKSFQRRFRPQLISNIVDQESYEILKSLI